MLFGSPLAVHQLIPRPTLDVQFLGYAMNEPMPETRWIDRIVCEENIVQAWEQLHAKYLFFMPKPFRDIDPVTLTRRDAPPGFRVFREAAVNLLIHQDYGDHSRKAAIKFYRDGIQFWNPGDVFGDDSRLWEPGEKEVRNPSIAMALRRIAMCEQAGTGLRMIRDEWKKLGHPAPTCKNDRSVKAFEFFLPVEIGDWAGAAQSVAQSAAQSNTHDMTYRLLTALANGERTPVSLRSELGLKHRSRFRENYIHPALDAGLIEYTIPDKPNSRLQKYRITERGRQFLLEAQT